MVFLLLLFNYRRCHNDNNALRILKVKKKELSNYYLAVRNIGRYYRVYCCDDLRELIEEHNTTADVQQRLIVQQLLQQCTRSADNIFTADNYQLPA